MTNAEINQAIGATQRGLLRQWLGTGAKVPGTLVVLCPKGYLVRHCGRILKLLNAKLRRASTLLAHRPLESKRFKLHCVHWDFESL